MSKKNIIARVGNFEVSKESSPYFDYLRIKTISGHWGIMYREDSEMYGKIMAMVRDKEQAKHLELYVLHIYYTTNIVIDEQFGLDFMNALEAMRDRMAKAQGEPTDEEESESIKEVEMLENARGLMKDL